MIRRSRSLILVAAAALACSADPGPAAPTPPPPPPLSPPIAGVPLGEIVIPRLPSPFYRFEYDTTGKVVFADYASGLRMYQIHYQGDRISELRQTGLYPERLIYFYDESGKVGNITYTDRAGEVYVRIHLTYAGGRLALLERERRVEGGFQFDKRMSFEYHPDGNLAQLTDQRLPFPGQTEHTYADRFEQYDGGINVDGFSLVHNEFFDHLVLLPGVRLQFGNPAVVTHSVLSGDGYNYRISWRYSYDAENRPLGKQGELVWLTGPNAGQQFPLNTTFSYR